MNNHQTFRQVTNKIERVPLKLIKQHFILSFLVNEVTVFRRRLSLGIKLINEIELLLAGIVLGNRRR